MTNQISYLPPALRELAQKHFVLLESNDDNKRNTIQFNLSGYSEVMSLIADFVKVCILALEAGENGATSHIPEPYVNISGVLAVILDLLPYEEADLLDLLRELVLQPDHLQPIEEIQQVDDQFLLENIFLTVPKELL